MEEEKEEDHIYYQKLKIVNKSAVEYKKNQLGENSPFHPSDATLSLFASLAYKEKEIKNEKINEILVKYELDDWTLISYVKNDRDNYFGVTFYNSQKNQLVISHQGTKFDIFLKDYLSDAQGVMRLQLTSQIHSACTYTALVLGKINQNKIHVSITGHSLGAWLAQITTFSSEYLNLNLVTKNFERKNRNPSYNIHTVVFDSPGCYEMLSLISNFYFPKYEKEADYMISNLDMTIYFNMPNFINGVNSHRHISRLLQIYREDEKMGDLKWYYKRTHDMDRFVDMLKPENAGNVKMLTVLNWPSFKLPEKSNKKTRGGPRQYFSIPELVKVIYHGVKHFFVAPNELRDFYDEFKKCCKNKKFYIEMNDKRTQYIATDFNGKTRRVSAFAINELNFLRCCQNFGKKNLAKDRFHTGEISLPKFEIKEENCKEIISCDSEEDVEKIINYVKNMLCNNSGLYEIIKEEYGLIPEVYQAYYESFSKNYVRKIPEFFVFHQNLKAQIEFTDAELKIAQFLKSKEKIFCLVTQQNTINEVFRIRKLLMSFEEDKQCYLSLVELKELEQLTDVVKIFRNEEITIDQFLIIDCGVEENLEDFDILKKLIDEAKNCENIKKLILIANKELEWCDVTARTGPGFAFKDFEEGTRRKLIQQEAIKYKNEKLSLLQFFGEKLIDDFFEKQTNVVNYLLQDLVIEELCSENIVNFDGVKIRILKVYQNIEHDKLRKFFVDLQDDQILFVISGDSDREKLKNYLEGINLDLIEITAIKDDPEKFYEICRKNCDSKIYWLHLSAGTIELREVFDSNFYINRRFYPQIILKDEPFEKAMKDKNIKEEFKLIYSKIEEKEANSSKISRINNNWIARFDDEISTTNQAQHCVVFRADDKLIWKYSTGSIEEIRKMAWTDISENLPESEFLKNEQKVVIIADEPGMGKSSTLLNIASRMNDTWVIWTNLINFRKKGIQWPPEIKIDTVVEFLQKTNPNLSNPLIASILKFNLENECRKPLVLFFDGFDEINEDTRMKIVKIFKYIKDHTKARLWIATRIWAKDILENKLSTFAIKMKEITEEEQLELITNIWQSRLMCPEKFKQALDDTAEELLKKLEKILIFDQVIPITLQKSIEEKMKYFLKNREILSQLINEFKDFQKLFFKLPEGIRRNFAYLYDVITTFCQFPPEFFEHCKIFADFLSWVWYLNKTQNLFVQKYLKSIKSDSNNLFIQKMLSILRISYEQLDNNSSNNFIGIPLQLRMIAEIARPNFIADEIVTQAIHIENFCNLYNEFVYRKIGIYFTEKLQKEFNEVNAEALIKKHELLGFQSLFPSQAKELLDDDDIFVTTENRTQQIQKINQIGFLQIFQNGEFQFVHNSFAEYFAAREILRLLKKLEKNWSHQQFEEFIGIDVLIKEEYKMIRKFLNDHVKGNDKIFEFLKEKNFEYQGPTPLLVAMNERNKRLAKKLIIVKNFDIDACDDFGHTAFYLAVVNSWPKLISRILGLNPKRNIWKIEVSENPYPIYLTHSDFHIRVLEFQNDNVIKVIDDAQEMDKIFTRSFVLLSQSTESNLSGLLFCAAINNNWNLFKKLLNSFPEELIKVIINIQEPHFGKTMLNFAAQKNQEDIVKDLLDKGAEINKADKNGNTPRDEAILHGHKNIAKLLDEYQEMKLRQDSDNSTELCHTADYGPPPPRPRRKELKPYIGPPSIKDS